MITLEEIKAAYPAKTILFMHDRYYYPKDIVRLADGTEILLDTHLHMIFLKEDVVGEYFDMTLLNKIGEAKIFNDDSIKTIVIANTQTDEKSKLVGFLSVAESEKATTFTFLAGGG